MVPPLSRVTWTWTGPHWVEATGPVTTWLREPEPALEPEPEPVVALPTTDDAVGLGPAVDVW
jgi:hypothetical protein